MTTIEKIKAEIDRRMLELAKDKYIDLHDTLCRTKELNLLLSFLSTLEEDEKPVPNDLEEAAKKYAHCPYTDDDGNFYEDAIDGTAYRDFIAGAKWQKQEMLKEAVEGEVYLYHSYNRDATAILVDVPKDKLGDKVRIIVLKKEDEK